MKRLITLAAVLGLLAAEEVCAQNEAKVEVDPAHILHAVDRRIYGENLENFARVIQGGLSAQLLRNRKFYPNDPKRTNVSEPWQAEANRTHVSYVIDRSISLDGVSSQRVSLFGEDRSWRGISQTGFDMLAGKSYVAYAWIRSQPVSGSVSFRLESSDGTLDAHAEADLRAGDWQKYEVRLTPTRDLRPAVFRIAFDASGAHWIGGASLMPADNVDGLRRDVVELIRQVGPTVYRWPGGGSTDLYDWRKGLGARDKRAPADAAADANDFGTDEFMRFCEQVGALPYISANYGSGTPEMAAQWVEYLNGPATSVWGARRAASGHPAPYGVKNWLLGNEMWSAYAAGHTNAEGYATSVVPIARAMKAVDPTIRITGIGLFADPKDKTWNEPVLDRAWQDLDLLSLHHYYPSVAVPPALDGKPLQLYRAIVAEPTIVEARIRQVIALADRVTAGRKQIDISLDEWNEWDMPKLPPDTSGGSSTNQIVNAILKNGLDFNHTDRDALYNARMLHALMRLSDRLPIAARLHVINSLGAIRTDSTRSYITSSGKAMELYRNHSGAWLVSTERSGPTFDVPETGWRGVPVLDAAATLSEDKRKLFVHLLNLDAESPLTVRLAIKSGTVSPHAIAWQIAPDDYMARNDFGSMPVEIRKSERSGGGGFSEVLPPHSMTTLELELNPAR